MGQVEEDLKKAGAVVYAISDEDPAALKGMKSKETPGDTFVYLSDKDASAAKFYAGQYEGKSTLKPATYVIDKTGKIVFAYADENYSIRAGADEVLKALRK